MAANTDLSDSDDELTDGSGAMSDDEEDMLDLLLQQTESDSSGDEYFPDSEKYGHSEGTVSQSSAENDPLGGKHFSWQDESVADTEAPFPPTFCPSRPPGIQLGRFTRSIRQDLKTPVDFFKLFLTPLLVMQMCIATNQFAELMIGQGQFLSYSNSLNQWDRVTVEEMYRFWGIVIYMSIAKYHSYARYWSTSPLYSPNPVCKAMTKKRFQSLLAFLQITPLPDVDKNDKLTRVRPLVDHVRTVSSELFQPYQHISADERMLPSKHQFSGIRQFVKNKPVRFGIKLWVLACSVTSYTCEFAVYLGKRFTDFKDQTKGLGYNVVVSLVTQFVNQNYILFLDCFYTSIDLAKYLLDKGISVVGVIKSRSRALPDCFKDVRSWEKYALRGDFRWHRNGQMLVVQWRDSKTVSLLSSIHCGSDITNCRRTLPARSGWKKKRLTQPQVVADYNKYMGGVDKSDQYLSKYPSYIRTKFHWWKVIFFHSLDIMIVNSYIVFLEFIKNFPNDIEAIPSVIGQLEYREAIVKSLLCPNVHVSTLTVDQCLPVFSQMRRDCVLCNARARLAGKPRLTVKSFVTCSKCQVYLCMHKERNCFSEWHSDGAKKEKAWCHVNSRKRKL